LEVGHFPTPFLTDTIYDNGPTIRLFDRGAQGLSKTTPLVVYIGRGEESVIALTSWQLLMPELGLDDVVGVVMCIKSGFSKSRCPSQKVRQG